MGLRPVLAVDEILDHAAAERARAVEGDGGDDVLEGVGLEVLEELLHAARLELEDAGGLAGLEELVGRRVVERDGAEVEGLLLGLEVGALVDEADGDVDDREGLEAEEVELDQARLLDVVLVVLGDDDLAVLEARDVIPERPLADDHARGVHAGVAGEALQLLRLLEQLGDGGVAVPQRLELGLDVEGLGDGVGDPGALDGDQVGDLLRLHGGEAHGAGHVLDDALGLQLVEGGDLPDAVLAVAIGDVGDDLVAPVHAEIDVEVGHAHALRVEEALEEQVVREGIEVGDPHRVRDQGAGAGAAAGADGDVVLLGEADEVPDDEEVAGEVHADDDVELGLEAAAVGVLVDLGPLRSHLGEAAVEALPGDLAEVVGGAHALGQGEAREHGLAELELEAGAALGDLQRALEGRGVIAEQVPHLLRRLEEHLEAAVVRGLRLGVGAVLGDAGEVELTLAVLPAAEVGVVAGDQGQAHVARGGREDAVEHALLLEAVVLELDVERAGLERVAEASQLGAPRVLALVEDALREHPAHAAGEADQALLVLLDEVEGDARRELARGLDMAAGDDADEVPVAGLAGGEEDQVVHGLVAAGAALGVTGAARHVDLAAEDGLDALLLARLVELDGAEHVAVVGERHRSHAERLRPGDEVLDLERTVEQRVLRMDVEMDELGCHGDKDQPPPYGHEGPT